MNGAVLLCCLQASHTLYPSSTGLGVVPDCWAELQQGPGPGLEREARAPGWSGGAELWGVEPHPAVQDLAAVLTKASALHWQWWR
jgi:hypothetical protein